MSQTVYTDLQSLVLLYQNGDLPEDELAWPYNQAPGKIAWVHRDELKKMVMLGGAYIQASNQKGKK